MQKSFKLALAAFGVALSAALMTAPLQAGETACHPKTCTVGGQSGICCLDVPGEINCTPCGGFET